MNLNLLFDIEVNNNLEVKWLSFKIETSLLYTYYREISKEECICIFKVVQKILADKGIVQSMSRKGNCLDNAVIENFFGTIKSELFYTKKFNSTEELQKEINEYIKYYNHDRIRLNLKGKSPVQYRTLSF